MLAEFGPLPACELAAAVRRRKAIVIATLAEDPRFHRAGKTKASHWGLTPAVRSFDAGEASERWGCDVETAREIIFGCEGFLERGYVTSLNGNGRVVVTERGLRVSAFVGSLDPEASA